MGNIAQGSGQEANTATNRQSKVIYLYWPQDHAQVVYFYIVYAE